ncbi:hypothetical protein P43SY_002345 [Pythium insidiosum]|uniref:Calpain catalytic domain-containing protein n=1 Tax=Pythium insidiosum TaxID=114742 RepID=A0AAD5LSY8_PYTIN|nr:hypothetical protein P43SY_002345 [Pythium insidiosum]
MELFEVPRTGGPTEDEIVQQLLREADPSGAAPLYEDPEFCPSEPSTLYLDAKKLPEYAGEHDGSVAWYRPTEYTDDPDYFKSPSGCGVLREGALHDAWLLGVFAAVALHPDSLIENLFVSESLDQFKQHGVYTCRFYKNARWVHVTTDTRVPYSVELGDDELRPAKGGSTPGHLLYGASLNKNEVFVPLLEKAYAKLHGCYQVLAEGHGGSVSCKILEAFLDCTGGSAQRIDLVEEKRRVQHAAMAARAGKDAEQDGGPDDDAESAKASESGDAAGEEQDLALTALWRRVVRYVKRKCIVTAQLRQLSFNAYDLTPTGILKNRQYVVLHTKEVSLGSSKASGASSSNNNNNNSSSSSGGGSAKEPVLRFVKLKNVWGRGMWKGEWSNDDSKWEEHLQVENALRNDPACAFSRSGTDGCFWMVWEDFAEVFNELFVVHVFGGDDAGYQYNVAGEWLGFTAAGAPSGSGFGSSSGSSRPGTTTVAPGDDATGWRKGERPIDRTKWCVLRDADPNWHRNPQFRLTVAERTRGVLISLAQRDFRLFGGDNFAVNLVLVAQKPTRTAMLWEHPPAGPKIAAEAHSLSGATGAPGTAESHPHRPTTSGATPLPTLLPERELHVEDVVLEPDAAYFLVPFTDHAKVEMEFFLRVVAPRPVTVERVAPVWTCLQQGKWRSDDDETGDATTAGGPLLSQLHSGDENAAWCQNPQFWLRLPPMGPRRTARLLAARPFATIKIILRKTSHKGAGGGANATGAGAAGAAAKSRHRDVTKDRPNLIGLTVVRGKHPLERPADDAAAGADAGSKRSAAQQHTSLLRAQAKAPKTNFLGEIVEKRQWKLDDPKAAPRRRSSGADHRRNNDDEDDEDDDEDDDDGGAERDDDAALGADAKDAADNGDSARRRRRRLQTFPAPRLVVKPDEWCRVSEYSSPLVACTYLRKVPKEWLLASHGGLMIVPTLGEPNAEGTFDLQVDADFPLELDELPRFTTQRVPGEWTESTAVGCHLHSDWKKNPKLYLYLKGVRPAKVKITLTRSELEWQGKCKRDPVGTMIGFYLFQGSRLLRAVEHQAAAQAQGTAGGRSAGMILVNGRPWSETDFVPLHSVVSPPELILPSAFHDPYVIMPATYEPGKTGRFVVSVQCDTEFTLSADEP